MAECNPQTLMDSAACFACLPEDQKQTLKLQLLCEILQAGGGVGVTSIIAGAGISINQSTGAVTITATTEPSMFAGIGDPNGVQSATGPAIYFDRTDPLAPVWYSKNTAGTSNNEWIG